MGYGRAAKSITGTASAGKAAVGWQEACVGALGRASQLLREALAGEPARQQGPGGAPVRHSQACEELQQLSGVIEGAALQVERAGRWHAGAGQRVDAALYELEQLRRDLEAVVDPALLAGTRRILAADAGAERDAAAAARDESGLQRRR